jgi:hypothetical protein
MSHVSVEAPALGVGRAGDRRPGLRREVGFIGLLWASTGSIIGSGWLFGAQGALSAAGPAAIISWVIGAAAILLLALVHAELGGMYPVAGGTARFPHYAFGGAAGRVVRLVLVAAGGHRRADRGDGGHPVRPALLVRRQLDEAEARPARPDGHGSRRRRRADGDLHRPSTSSACAARPHEQRRHLVEGRRARCDDRRLEVTAFHTSNFTAANGFNPYGAQASSPRSSTSGIIFAPARVRAGRPARGREREPASATSRAR